MRRHTYSSRDTRPLVRLGMILLGIGGIAGITLSLWLTSWRPLASYSLQSSSPRRLPDYILEDLSYTVMSPEGLPRYRIVADTMTRYSNDKITEFEAPLLWYFRAGEPPLEASADRAEMSPDRDEITLWDNVIINQPPTPGRRAYTLKTDYARVYPEREFATTDRPLTVVGANFFLESVGGDIDLRGERVNFHSQVNGIYEP